VARLAAARAAGLRAAVVSASAHARLVLERAALAERFDVMVTGVEISALGLAGKPAPDAFLEAARRVGVAPDRCAVVEDAAAGVRAGSAEQVEAALDRGRRLEPVLASWHDALVTGRDTARLSPQREERRAFWSAAQKLTRGLSRSSRNLRVLVRRSVAALQEGQGLPECLPALLEELAAAVEQAASGDAAVGPLVELAAKLDPVALGATTLAGQVVVGQLRVAIVDLLEGLGLEHDRARDALPALAS
jgi:hypothetical protein